MKRAILLYGLLLTWQFVCPGGGAGAQTGTEPRVIPIPVNNLPRHLYVLRGSVVEFQGTVPDEDRDVLFVLRSGLAARASGQFRKTWALRWDSSHEPGTTAYLSVAWYRMNGEEVRLFRVPVEILNTPPFSLAAPADGASLDGMAKVEVVSKGGIPAAGFEVLLDDVPTGTNLGADGKGSVDTSVLKPGQHLLSVAVKTQDGGMLYTPAVNVEIRPWVRILPLDNGNTLDLRKVEVAPKVVVSIQCRPEIKPAEATLYLDGKSVAHASGSPEGGLAFDPNPIYSGEHVLTVEVVDEDGKRHLSQELTVTLVRDAKREFREWTGRLDEILQLVTSTFAELITLSGRTDLNIPEKEMRAEALGTTLLTCANRIRKLYVPKGLKQEDRDTLGQAKELYADAFAAASEVAARFISSIEAQQRFLADPRGLSLAQLVAYASSIRAPNREVNWMAVTARKYREATNDVEMVREHVNKAEEQ